MTFQRVSSAAVKANIVENRPLHRQEEGKRVFFFFLQFAVCGV